MKKNNSFVRDCLSFAFLLILSLALGSCSSDKSGDLRELFNSIPSDVSFVGVIDSEELLKQSGFKVKKGSIVPGKETEKFFAENTDKKLEFLYDLICDGGVEPSCMALFTEGYNSYLTGFLSDTDKFKDLVESHFREKTAATGEFSTCGNIAFTSNRFWCCLTSRNTINIDNIRHFSTLSEKQSFISAGISDELMKSDKIMRGWGDIKGCLNASGMEFSTKASLQMGLEALFEDAVEFIWNMDIDKDELEIDLNLLNSKGGIAAFLYPASKAESDQIKAADISGDAVLMLAVSPKFTDRMKKDTRGKGMSVIGMISGMISDVSGTVMVAADNADNISGVIPVKGNNTSGLNQLLSQYGFSVTQDNGAMRFTKGTCSGKITSDVTASVLKDKMAGLIISPDSLTQGKIDYAAFMLSTDKGGMKMSIEVKAKDHESLMIGLLRAYLTKNALNGN